MQNNKSLDYYDYFFNNQTTNSNCTKLGYRNYENWGLPVNRNIFNK